MTTTEECYAQATEMVRRALEAGLSEPYRTQAIKELEARSRRCVKAPGADTASLENTAPGLWAGSVLGWGDKTVLRLKREGHHEEAAVLFRQLETMKATRPAELRRPTRPRPETMTNEEIPSRIGELLGMLGERVR